MNYKFRHHKCKCITDLGIFTDLGVFTDLGAFVLPKHLQVWARPYTNIHKSKMQIGRICKICSALDLPGEGTGWRMRWGTGDIRALLPDFPLACGAAPGEPADPLERFFPGFGTGIRN